MKHKDGTLLSATPTSHVTNERVQARAHKCAQMQKSGRFVSCVYLANFVYILYIRLPTWDKSAGTIRLTDSAWESKMSPGVGICTHRARYNSAIHSLILSAEVLRTKCVLNTKILRLASKETGKPSASAHFLSAMQSQPSYAAWPSRERKWCH